MTGIDERYSRQVLLREIGEEGQRRLESSAVLVVGCGAVGSNLASLLVRAGIGSVRIVDRDVLVRSNLHRQVLYDESDVASGSAKATAAARRLRQINSAVTIDERVVDVRAHNVEELLDGMSLALDGTDNFETRYVLNDACVKRGVPWVYGGVVGAAGMTMSVIPGEGPCFRCVFPNPLPPGSMHTANTLGVLGTAPALVAALEATEAFKILVGSDQVNRQLLHVDPWRGVFRAMDMARRDDCPCCVRREFEFLDAK